MTRGAVWGVRLQTRGTPGRSSRRGQSGKGPRPQAGAATQNRMLEASGTRRSRLAPAQGRSLRPVRRRAVASRKPGGGPVPVLATAGVLLAALPTLDVQTHREPCLHLHVVPPGVCRLP